ncbi:MAG: hypothetical protein JW804_06650 [Sedimentisphaerales bacterium]|nr:hypothetical protein [Sedimentisphaerales bacterium]
MTSAALFLLSAAVLALELILVRLFAISHWHHFAHLVISTALLGFGAGGTFVTIFSNPLGKKPLQAASVFALAMAVSIPIVLKLSQLVPLDELQIIWDYRQLIYLSLYYLLFFIPFFFAACTIAVIFTAFGQNATRLYFFNMAGSGLGTAVIISLMYGNAPQQLLLAISAIAFLSSALFASGILRIKAVFILLLGALYIFIFSPFGFFHLDIKISENKSLVYYRNIPKSETIATRYSPLARIDCLSAPSIRNFPGLSIAYQDELPAQMLLISDADSTTAVNHFTETNQLNCYRHTTSALAYHIIDKPDTCIIGSGGGSDIAQAVIFAAKQITAVEMNAQILSLIDKQLKDFSGNIYGRKNVNVVIAEGRNFLETTKEKFDLINISLLDSFTASAAGLYALNESHLYTIEAIEKNLEKLNENGVLSITRILKWPPRDSLKMLATVKEALIRRGVKNPAQNIIMIRGWSTATIVVSPAEFSEIQTKNAQDFAHDNSFDLIHIPGIRAEQANRFDVLDKPYYYNAAQAILSDEADKFYNRYDYYIRPAADDRPYFFDFFKLKSMPKMIKTFGKRWLVFSEWGYIVLVANTIQAITASIILIVLPLLFCKPLKKIKTGKMNILIYFICLGLAYMFLEMGFIQKMTLLIGRPVFGVAATLVSFLFFSGLGSLTASKLKKLSSNTPVFIRYTIAALIIIGLAEILLLNHQFDYLVAFSLPARIILAVALPAPLAFLMGIPFPTALQAVHRKAEVLVAWSWGANGFASVIAAVLGTLGAISAGFTIVAVTALALYIIAAVVCKNILADS